MFYIANSIDFKFNWEQSYLQLTQHYQKLLNDYQNAISLGDQLRLKIENITKENEQIRTKKINSEFLTDPHQLSSSLVDSPPKMKQITTKISKKMSARKKKSIAMKKEMMQDSEAFQCTYPNCSRVYSSPVSMNLHIKLKHNGGTKKQRQQYAKQLLEAEAKGVVAPFRDIDLPPDFIEEFRTSYEYMKRYSM